MTNKICVYTCITGEYDNLKEIEKKEENIDYYCFTNNKKIKSKTWNIIYIEDKNLSNVKLARKTKILGHSLINEKYDILIWMDAAVIFKKKIIDFLKTYLTDEDDFVAFKHGERKSIEEECVACYKFGKENRENINKILEFYKKEKYKDDNGLIESTVFIRRTHTKKIEETMNLWFEMIDKFSKRDQLSFNYCIYKTGLVVKWINEKVFDNEWFDWISHNSTKGNNDYKIYFGDYSNDYSMEYDIQNSYKEGKYIKFNVKSPRDTNELLIRLEKKPCSIFNYIKINDELISNSNFRLYNCSIFESNVIFYNCYPIIHIEKMVKKDEILKIEIFLEKMPENDIYKLIEFLSIKGIKNDDIIKNLNNQIQDLYKLNSDINNKLSLIVNSKGYIYLEKIRKIKNKLRL